MADACYAGIDLGGTNIKSGTTDRDGNIVSRCSIPTEADRGPDHVIDRIVIAAEMAIKESGQPRSAFVGLGIGSPGPLLHREGVIIKTSNMPGWVNVQLTARVGEKVGMPTVLENDGNAAALGEYWVGAGKGVRDMVMFTLGTGVGGGIVSNGRLLRGAFDNAGELGHMLVQPGGRRCGCGQLGCLEAYASASRTVERAIEAIEAGEPSSLTARLEAGESVECEHIERAAVEGDPLAARIWDESAYYLAVACVNVQHFLNAERVVLAGGMAAAGDLLLTPLRDHFNKLTWNLAKDQPDIRLAALGNDAGLIGATAAVWLAQQEGEL